MGTCVWPGWGHEEHRERESKVEGERAGGEEEQHVRKKNEQSPI